MNVYGRRKLLEKYYLRVNKKNMILIIDNYDSFTYNLFQYLSEVSNSSVEVIRNDKISIEEIKELKPSHIILSPGPCTPNETGICQTLIKELHSFCPILGVCLGHQTIAQVFGAKVIKAKRQMHGKTSKIIHDNQDIFESCNKIITVARYHSLIVKDLPSEVKIRAITENDEIMAISHRKHPHIIGIQFHPESILTKSGKDILKSFVKREKQDFYGNNTTLRWP